MYIHPWRICPGTGSEEDGASEANPGDPMTPGVAVARHALLQQHRGDFGAPHVSFHQKNNEKLEKT